MEGSGEGDGIRFRVEESVRGTEVWMMEHRPSKVNQYDVIVCWRVKVLERCRSRSTLRGRDRPRS